MNIMEIEFFDEKSLARRIKSEEKITFIFGSALTSKKDGIGIPNVDEMKGMAINFIREQDDGDDIIDYSKFMEKKLETDENDYQKTFSFIINNYGIKHANNIIRNAIMSNIDESTGRQKIPKSISTLVEKIKENTIAVNNIITTNFDTLIEEQLNYEDVKHNGISIVSDSQINDNSNEAINVIHIHGVWNKNDTMHTRSQLNNCRSKIESSLKKIIAKNTVVIMGYGGWDDSFMRSLIDLINDDSADYTILWCFYESNESKIESNVSFFESLRDATTRGRISFYKGIDCNVFFENIKKKKIETTNQ